MTIIAEAELVDGGSGGGGVAVASAPPAKGDGGKTQPATAEAIPMATAQVSGPQSSDPAPTFFCRELVTHRPPSLHRTPPKGALSPDGVTPVIAEKPVVKLTVVIANEDGFKDLYNILTVPQPQFANIQELTLQPTDEYVATVLSDWRGCKCSNVLLLTSS